MKPLSTNILTIITISILNLCCPLSLLSEGVKTHYKQYTIYTYENQDYLCEPYQVKKDDWLYKIFRQKGEISASDFPKFLKIFKEINPQLNNIDAITPGSEIVIPLKIVNKDAYEQKEDGVVEVPVLEFSLGLDEKALAEFIRKHEVQSGDTVSQLLPKEFLKKSGAVSEVGEKTFTQLNPEIKDINRIYSGAHVLIPDPEILTQPWFENLLVQGMPEASSQLEGQAQKALDKQSSNKPLPVLSQRDISRLKRYAQLIQGRLMHEGKMYFPGKQGGAPKALDLSKTPVIDEDTGQKTLILPPDTSAEALDKDLVEAMKAYWQELRLQELDTALSRTALFLNKESMDDVPKSQKELVKRLLEITPYSYETEANFPVSLNKVDMTVSLGRITHEMSPDILVNTGSVYGIALEVIKEQGYKIINLSPDMTFEETCLLLFSELGYECWKNPSFNTEGRVETIPGIYTSKETDRHFITRTPLLEKARSFLGDEGISLLILDKEPAL
ncbi:MAG: hypothetical protein MI892_10525 [Desulfobacterales bacterium]|nr:hypothetical protein [Desulfobacterales bacterium]